MFLFGALGFGHVDDQVDHTGTVTPFVVIPRHQLHEVVTQCDSSLGIENARPAVTNEVS